ncbi:MAG: hypothetical protein HZB55_10215 [Deltaproteobacteria bacterium]|nr:hypothetical protein [Deltaproteobacteria bacterium]
MTKRKRLLCGTAAVLLGFPPAAARAAVPFGLQSDTVVRFFSQERAGADKEKGVPAYEYLRADAGHLDGPGLSAHAYGWGRYDLGSYYDDKSEGEILYGYLQYAWAANNAFVRAGRQYVFQGVADDTVDGLRVGSDVTPYATLSAYGGQPVSLETTNGRAGDRTWGGRAAHHFGGYYEIGVSFQRTDNDGERQEERLGIDSSITPPGPVSLTGASVRNLATDAWSEHAYEARLALGPFDLRPSFQRFDYGAYFGDGDKVPQVFRFLKSSDEIVTTLGAGASWVLPNRLEVAAKAKHYDYREATDTAWYGAGLLTYRLGGASEVGAEGGRMHGSTADNRYWLWRGHGYWEKGALLLSGDAVYVTYDEDIQDRGHSTFASLGAGTRLLSDALKLTLSGEYSADPYFDKDLRATLTAQYSFGAK